jgi:hypothetical protein
VRIVHMLPYWIRAPIAKNPGIHNTDSQESNPGIYNTDSRESSAIASVFVKIQLELNFLFISNDSFNSELQRCLAVGEGLVITANAIRFSCRKSSTENP